MISCLEEAHFFKGFNKKEYYKFKKYYKLQKREIDCKGRKEIKKLRAKMYVKFNFFFHVLPTSYFLR